LAADLQPETEQMMIWIAICMVKSRGNHEHPKTLPNFYLRLLLISHDFNVHTAIALQANARRKTIFSMSRMTDRVLNGLGDC
jgi:hypothetical protein